MLGLLPGAVYEQDQRSVRPGDVLVLYSDGLVEAADAAGEEYGEGRLHACLAAACGGSPAEIRAAVLASADAFLGAAQPHDDVTLVVAQFA